MLHIMDTHNQLKIGANKVLNTKISLVFCLYAFSGYMDEGINFIDICVWFKRI